MKHRLTLAIVLAASLIGSARVVGAVSVGFEVSGSLGHVDPSDFNELFARAGFDPIDRAVGVSAGVFVNPIPALRVFGAVGFLRGSTNEMPILVTDPTGRPLGTSSWSISARSVPVSVGSAYQVGVGRLTMVVSLAGEMHFVRVASSLEPVGTYEGFEESSSATALGLNGTIGTEWRFSSVVGMGVRGGYRSAKANVSFPGIASPEEFDLDLSGGYGAVYMVFWSGGGSGR